MACTAVRWVRPAPGLFEQHAVCISAAPLPSLLVLNMFACVLCSACRARHCKECGVAVVSSTVPGAYAWMRGEKHEPNLDEAVTYFTALANATDLPFWQVCGPACTNTTPSQARC